MKTNVNEFMELGQIFTVLVRRWMWLLLGALIGGTLGYTISQSQTPIYQATTSLLVGQSLQSTSPDRLDLQVGQQLALTYADIALRQPVLQSVIDTLELNQSWRTLRSLVEVSLVPDTQIMEVSAQANSPERAQEIADEVANALIRLSPTNNPQTERSQEVNEFAYERLQRLQARIQDGMEKLAALDADLAEATSPVVSGRIQEDIDELESQIAVWDDTFARLLSSIGESQDSANYLAVVEPAQARLAPVRPNVRLNTILALLVGLVMGSVLAFIVDRVDDTLKTTDDVESLLHVPALAKVSGVRSATLWDGLIVNQEPFSAIAEDYRLLRSKLQFMAQEMPLRRIMVTAVAKGDDKSSVAANLSLALAQAAQRTILVDADLRSPMQHQIFQTQNEEGLTQFLRAKQLPDTPQLESALDATTLPTLRLLTSGTMPPNPAELLGSQRMQQLLVRLSELANVVVCDSAPANGLADALVLSGQTDGVILVATAGRTRARDTRKVLKELRQTGANILGVVLVQKGASTQPQPYALRQLQPASASANGRAVRAR